MANIRIAIQGLWSKKYALNEYVQGNSTYAVYHKPDRESQGIRGLVVTELLHRLLAKNRQAKTIEIRQNSRYTASGYFNGPFQVNN